jgi:hypothetical protein
MMAEEGHELEGKAPRAQHPALKIRSKIETRTQAPFGGAGKKEQN